MPVSSYEVIPEILNFIVNIRPSTILDVGVGFGKYGVLLRESLEIVDERYDKQEWRTIIEGVEAFRNYRNPLHEYCYDKVYYADIFSIIDNLKNYDLIMLIDVIEHFQKDKGFKLINALLKHCNKALLISTPLFPASQEAVFGNEYEIHRSRWKIVDFVDYDFNFRIVGRGKKSQLLVAIFPSKYQLHNTIRHHTGDLWFHDSPVKYLTIAAHIPHRQLTGGLKSFLNSLKWLRERGHKIIVFGDQGDKKNLLPSWSDLTPDKVLFLDKKFSTVINSSVCDIVLTVWWEQLPQLAKTDVPVVYWEKGHQWLFGDDLTLLPDFRVRQWMEFCYHQPCHIATVSDFASRALHARFGVSAAVVPEGVDTTIYIPATEVANRRTILLMGNPSVWFKGFDTALCTLDLLWKKGYRFRVKWICQVKPEVIDAPFPIDYIVNPPQKTIPEHIRHADIFLFCSWYESFALPPLEAMACGVPVIATDCGGIRAYAVNEQNALLVDPGDHEQLAEKISLLLYDDALRESLRKAGRQTALQFDRRKTIAILERYLSHIARC
ncbi:MAG: glycosyltransferase family 1 protein [Deltaproteobacteria bacterium]|nr:MAG: glycosyltransferase family 1 protein [Deltaproteobacteria bacterium]